MRGLITAEEINPSKVSLKPAEWAIFNNHLINNIVYNGLMLAFTNRNEVISKFTKNCSKRQNNQSNCKKMRAEIKSLCEDKIIVKIANNAYIYPNHIFIIKQKEKNRVIFDMTDLNKYIITPTFKFIKVEELYPFFLNHKFATKVDLTKAYYHIDIHSKFKKYFTFAFEGIKYQWNKMPFGLTSAPYIFSICMETIVTYLRSKHNITIFFYLDDFILFHNSSILLTRDTYTTTSLFRKLGLTINGTKSIINPCTYICFLGIQFDLKEKTLQMNRETIDKCMRVSKIMSKDRSWTLKSFQKITGLLNYASRFIKAKRSYIHDIYRHTFIFRGKSEYSTVTVPQSLQKALIPWTRESLYQKIQITLFAPDATLITDASSTGWSGIFIWGKNQASFKGRWSHKEVRLHVNTKETLAVLRALQRIPAHIKDINILILTDNVTAQANLNKQGCSGNLQRREIMKKINKIISQRNIIIKALHLPGSKNCAADAGSRETSSINTESSLSRTAFKRLTMKLKFPPELDLFATPTNKKTKRFVSAIPHPEAKMLNAFSIPWDQPRMIYAFPPPALINKVLYKWKKEKTNNFLILIAPDLPKKTWYSSLHKEAIKIIDLELKPGEIGVHQLEKWKPCPHNLWNLKGFLL